MLDWVVGNFQPNPTLPTLHTVTGQLCGAEKGARVWTSLAGSLFILVQLFVALFMSTTKCNTRNVFLERPLRECILLYLKAPTSVGSLWCWAFHPAFWSLTWLDRVSYKPDLRDWKPAVSLWKQVAGWLCGSSCYVWDIKPQDVIRLKVCVSSGTGAIQVILLLSAYVVITTKGRIPSNIYLSGNFTLFLK